MIYLRGGGSLDGRGGVVWKGGDFQIFLRNSRRVRQRNDYMLYLIPTRCPRRKENLLGQVIDHVLEIRP